MNNNNDNQIRSQLELLVEKTGAINALLISKEGVNIDEAGNTGFLNTTALAALIAGMFTATKEVARMVGEAQFSILLQQGEKRHIHISLIDNSTMMVIIFEDYNRIGMVRLEAKKIGQRILSLLEEEHDMQRDREERSSKPKFREYALNLVDRIFTD